MPHIAGIPFHGAFFLLLFIHFYRQVVRIPEEKELLAGVLILADLFVYNAQGIQLGYGLSYVVDLKSQMAQTCCFWMGHPRRG